jgi:hypothetical protein
MKRWSPLLFSFLIGSAAAAAWYYHQHREIRAQALGGAQGTEHMAFEREDRGGKR